jgi:hypothetical protein
MWHDRERSLRDQRGASDRGIRVTQLKEQAISPDSAGEIQTGTFSRRHTTLSRSFFLTAKTVDKW